MNVQYAIQFKKEFIASHPLLKEEVNDYFQLMCDEIEEGGSTSNEVQIFISACNDLLI